MHMEALHDFFLSWLVQYGSITLFFLLALGIIAFPVPEETLMVFAGILMSNGELRIAPTILAALAGSITGITISYMLGKTLGHFFLHKYGGWVGIKTKHVDAAHSWFEHYGKWSLFIGYFIPGIRHFTGFTAGTTDLEFRHFALFAYVGALFWVSTFLSIGYFFGHVWLALFKDIEIGLESTTTLVVLGIALGVLAFYFIRKKYKSRDK